jgi:hypothetical protein
MECGFDPLKVKVRENPAWVALRGEVPSKNLCRFRKRISGFYP